MLILSIESAAQVASVALVEDSVLLAESYLDAGLTHSETLAALVEELLANARRKISEVELFAVSAGPGSFTGVRIGVAVAKGMALALERPCVAVSTLRAMAFFHEAFEGILCVSMDARRGRVYSTLFSAKAGKITRLTEDQAIPISDLLSSLENLGEKVLLIGDGASLCYQELEKMQSTSLENFLLAMPCQRFQRASSVAFLGQQLLKAGRAVSAMDLSPIYLQVPQAERERLKKVNFT